MTCFTVNGIAYTTTSTTNVRVGGGDVSLQHNAFSNDCPSIIDIPPTVSNSGTTYSVTEVGVCAFYLCVGVTKINFPDSIVNIDANSCDRLYETLTSVELPQNLKYIGSYAFASSSIKTVRIPASVERIGHCPFGFDSALESIVVDSGNRYFCCDDIALYNIAKTRLIQVLPRVKTVHLPDTVKEISNYALAVVDAETLFIPVHVKKLDYLLHFCNNLRTIYIYGNIFSYHEKTFEDCSNIENIYYFGSFPMEKSIGCIQDTTVLHVCEGYKGSTIFGKTEFNSELCYSQLIHYCPSLRYRHRSNYNIILIIILVCN